jgi:tetratricopeptide (TPR) repeat protein
VRNGVIFGELPIGLQDLLCGVSVYRLPFGEAMAQAIGPTATIEDLELLGDRGLLLRQGEAFTLQPLVAELVRSRVAEAVRVAGHEGAIGYFERNVRGKRTDGDLEDCREELEIFYHACEIGDYKKAYSIYYTINGFLFNRGFYQEQIRLLEQLVRQWAPSPENAYCFCCLGNAYRALGQYQRAIDFHQQSLEIKREIGDRGGEAISLGNLGNAYHSLGQYQPAIDFHQQSLAITREIGDRWWEGGSLVNMGLTLAKLNRRTEALNHFQQAKAIYQDLQLDHMIEKCDNEIQRCNQAITKKQRNQRLQLFLIWFCVGLAIVLLIYWLKR